jgi:hypothetical protein
MHLKQATQWRFSAIIKKSIPKRLRILTLLFIDVFNRFSAGPGPLKSASHLNEHKLFQEITFSTRFRRKALQSLPKPFQNSSNSSSNRHPKNFKKNTL